MAAGYSPLVLYNKAIRRNIIFLCKMASAGNETSTVEVPTENPEAEDLDVFVKELMDNSKSLLSSIFYYIYDTF